MDKLNKGLANITKSVISRRAALKAIFLSALASSSAFRSAAATIPVTFKQINTGLTTLGFSLTSSVSANAYIEYGYTKGSYTKKSSIISLTKSVPKTITLNGLTPATTVYFRIRYAVGTSKTYSALSASSAKTGGKLVGNVFAVQADPHMDENSSADVYNGTLQQIVAASPTFLMDLGDIFMVDKLADKSEANIRARFELMKGYYAKLQNIPLKITLGNHDGELGYSQFNTKKYRKEYFPEQTGDLAYYSFETENSLHISLDPFTYTTESPKIDGWQWTLGKTQYDWLKQTLQSSTAPHKFIYIHHLLVGDAQSRGGSEIAKYNEWGGYNKDGTYGFDTQRPGWGKPVHQILKDNKVSIVFKGHDHLYVKQELDGIIYQTVPQPSHPGEKIDVTQYGYVGGKGVGGSGFLKVTTTATEAKVDFIKFDGVLGDTYVKNA
jgi:Calcineurin-like phosphoesterase